MRSLSGTLGSPVVLHVVLLLRALFAGGRVASPLDELVKAVQWARNVAYSELGIETHDDGPLAIESPWRFLGFHDGFTGCIGHDCPRGANGCFLCQGR